MYVHMFVIDCALLYVQDKSMLICALLCTHKLAAVVVLLGANWVSDYRPISAYCACTRHVRRTYKILIKACKSTCMYGGTSLKDFTQYSTRNFYKKDKISSPKLCTFSTRKPPY